MVRSTLSLKIEPRILKYARHCSGYDVAEVAKKAKIKEEKIVALENVKDDISLAQLEKLASVYKFPLTFFLLREIPKDVILPKDFRIVYTAEKKDFTPKLLLAVRWARYVQSTIRELKPEPMEYVFDKISIRNNAEQAAAQFREEIGISHSEQSKWSNPNVALKNWKEAIERMGVFVLQQSLSSDVSAFCLADQEPYIIVLNSSEHENRRIFSIFHEIGHILLHNSGVCTPDNFSKNTPEYIAIEKFCNQFAGTFLLPSSELLGNEIVQRIKDIPFENWNRADIQELSIQYRVSQEVIYRRLVSLKIINSNQYEQKRDELLREFEEYKKRRRAKEIKIPQYRKIISRNGRAYASFILENLHSNRITFAAAAEYLSTNSQHIANVEAHL